MRFREIISELFVQPAPLQWMRKEQYEWTAIFRIGREEYQIDFVGDDRIGFAFASVENGFGVTGAGNAATVMATVLASAKQVVRERNPKTISCSANTDEPSRVRLYDHIAKRMVNEFPDYRFETYMERGDKHYLFVRSDLPKQNH